MVRRVWRRHQAPTLRILLAKVSSPLFPMQMHGTRQPAKGERAAVDRHDSRCGNTDADRQRDCGGRAACLRSELDLHGIADEAHFVSGDVLRGRIHGDPTALDVKVR